MAARREYFDGCAVAHALDLVGERWSLLVVRELVLGPKRFTDLRAGLPQASPNVLSQRLRELEGAGVLRRRRLPPPAASTVYELTEWGQGLEPALQHLGRWGVRSPSMPPSEHIGVDAFVLALRTMFEPAAADGVHLTCDLRLGEQTFHARVDDGTFEITRGAAGDVDAEVTGTSSALAAVVFGDLPLAAAIDSGQLTIDGDPRAVAELTTLFPLPERAIAS